LDQQSVDNIFQQYPWASDSTLKAIIMAITNDEQVVLRELRRIKRDFEELSDSTDKMDSLQRSLSSYVSKVGDTAKSTMGTLTRDIDPIAGTAELMDTVAKASEVLGDASEDILKSGSKLIKNPFAKGLLKLTGGAADLLGSTAGKLAAAGALVGKAISSYDAEMRASIDMGALSDNLDDFNLLKDNAAGLGMSLQELYGAMGDSMYAFTNMSGGNTYDAQLQFTKFVHALKDGPEAINRLGYSVGEFSTRLAEEAKMLYDISDLDSLNQQTQKRIAEAFTTSTEIATMLANVTGDKRSELLAEREQAKTDVDIVTAMRINQEEFQKMYGEAGPAMVNEAYGNLAMAAKMLGPGLQELIMDATKRGIQNTRFDTDIKNDIGEELATQLSAFPMETQEMILTAMQAVITDADSAATDSMYMLRRFGDAAKTLANQDFADARGNEYFTTFNENLAQAKNTVKLLSKKSYDELKDDLLNVGTLADTADDAIEVIDGARISLRNMYSAIIPKHRNLQAFLEIFESSLGLSVSAITTMLPSGTLDPKEAAEEQLANMLKKQEADRQALDDMKRYQEILDRPTSSNAKKRVAQKRIDRILSERQVSAQQDLEFSANRKISLGDDGKTVVVKNPDGSKSIMNVKKGETVNTTADGKVFVTMDSKKLVPTTMTNAEVPLTNLLSLIGKGEASGSYDASNNPTGSDLDTSRGGKKLTEMTIAEVMYWQNEASRSERLGAVGKYQMIPSTFKEAVERGGYDKDAIFNAEMQDKMATDWFLLGGVKRPMLSAFLKGTPYNGREVSVEEAMTAGAMEWAALPVPYDMAGRNRRVRAGESYYEGDGQNSANISIDAYRKALIDAKNQLANKSEQPKPQKKSVPDIKEQVEDVLTKDKLSAPPVVDVKEQVEDVLTENKPSDVPVVDVKGQVIEALDEHETKTSQDIRTTDQKEDKTETPIPSQASVPDIKEQVESELERQIVEPSSEPTPHIPYKDLTLEARIQAVEESIRRNKAYENPNKRVIKAFETELASLRRMEAKNAEASIKRSEEQLVEQSEETMPDLSSTVEVDIPSTYSEDNLAVNFAKGINEDYDSHQEEKSQPKVKTTPQPTAEQRWEYEGEYLTEEEINNRFGLGQDEMANENIDRLAYEASDVLNDALGELIKANTPPTPSEFGDTTYGNPAAMPPAFSSPSGKAIPSVYDTSQYPQSATGQEIEEEKRNSEKPETDSVADITEYLKKSNALDNEINRRMRNIGTTLHRANAAAYQRTV